MPNGTKAIMQLRVMLLLSESQTENKINKLDEHQSELPFTHTPHTNYFDWYFCTRFYRFYVLFNSH